MPNSSQQVKDWRRNTKQRIVDSFGNKCGCCGYSRCQDALELHHLDPTEKDFSLGSIRANPTSWAKIANELRKCVMLCAICHREVHAGMRIIPDDCSKFDEAFADYKAKQKEENFDTCPVCKCRKHKTTKTCSLTCASTLRGKVAWDQHNLVDLFQVQKLSRLKIAEIVGCSDVSVAKRLKKLKLL